ncbi:ABC transporter substrate binding protein [Nisaea sp.]|uniref:ABC transporter substrate binding protein n=1 Tax=Nisaea sp. TaxID=2024842 RepID=UPI003297531E
MDAAERGTPKRILILNSLSSYFLDDSINSFKREMARLGFEEGKDVSYSVMNAEGDFAYAESMLVEAMIKAPPDLVVTVASLASLVARELLSDTAIPQIFMIVTDPVGVGFVEAMNTSSHSNITGQTHVVPAEFRLALVSKILETAKRDKPFRIGVPRSTYSSAIGELSQLRTAATKFPILEIVDLGFPYVPGEKGGLAMRDSALKLIEGNKNSLDGLWLVPGPNITNPDFVNAILDTGVPIVNGGNIRNVRLGAMLAIHSTAELIGKSGAETASMILSGTAAGEIPVTRPSKFIAGVNVSTAAMLGAIVPSEILELAQDNVFHQQGRTN